MDQQVVEYWPAIGPYVVLVIIEIILFLERG